MSARHKLNSIHLALAIGLASFAGLLTQSSFVFCLALILILAAHHQSGAIRTDSRRRPTTRPRNRGRK